MIIIRINGVLIAINLFELDNLFCNFYTHITGFDSIKNNKNVIL